MEEGKMLHRLYTQEPQLEKMSKSIVVATTFPYRDSGNPKPHGKPHTSTLAIHNPPPSRSDQVPNINRVHREITILVWELSDTEMT